MRWLRNIFRKKRTQGPQPLRIKGVAGAPATPSPDDAELAAQALLESRIYGGKSQRKAAKKQKASDLRHQTSDQPHDAAYYQQLADRIKEGRKAEALSAMRYVSYCEEQLVHHSEDVAKLQHGLFKWQDTVEREGGDLLKRWQKCLAEVIMRQMVSDEEESPAEGAENADSTNTDSKE